MKPMLLAAALLLAACDGPSSPPKLAAPQLEALEKAKAVDPAVQQNADGTKSKIDDAEK